MMKAKIILALALSFFVQAAVDEPEETIAEERSNRAPAVEEIQPESLSREEEDALMPFIDSSGTFNGSIHETFQIPHEVAEGEEVEG